MSLSALEQWELRLRKALDGVDRQLEERFSGELVRDPRRPAAGTTSSARFDGVFSVTSTFSLGLTTGDGPGYVIEVRVSAGGFVPETLRQAVMDEAEVLLRPAIAEAFPGRQLHLERQGNYFRLKGDLGFA